MTLTSLTRVIDNEIFVLSLNLAVACDCASHYVANVHWCCGRIYPPPSLFKCKCLLRQSSATWSQEQVS